MEVKEMTIADVLKTPAFYNNLKVVISDLENTRRKAGMMADAPLKRHPIDRLQERGVFEPGQMTVLYAKEKEKIIKVICGGIKMKRREISSSGNIGNDGKLRMYFGELNQFFAMHKGSRIIARFIVASPGSSEALKGYYFNYVVPTFRTGIWEAGERLTDEQTERRLRELSPVMYEQIPNIETGEYETRLRKISELSNAELIEHIEHLKQIAAEEYSIFIDDPKSF